MIVGSMIAAAVVLGVALASGGRGLDFTSREVARSTRRAHGSRR